MAYPNTNLSSDQLDPDYGGAPANRFGTPARAFINSVLQFLEQAFLTYVRVPWTTQVVISSSGNVVGDVCYFDCGTFVTAQGYYARNKNTGSGTAIVWGVFLDAANAGNKARIVTSGVVPPSVTGLGVQTAQAPVSVNASTGRLQAASPGDDIVGYFDVQGNVFLLAPGRLV